MTNKEIYDYIKNDDQLSYLLFKKGDVNAIMNALLVKKRELNITVDDINRFLSALSDKQRHWNPKDTKANRIYDNEYSGIDNADKKILDFKQNNIETIGFAAFKGAQIEEIHLGGVKEIEQEAFMDSTVSKIYFRNGQPINIGNTAFFRCKELKDLYIPTKAKVGDYAFAKSGIRRLSIGADVKPITDISICAFDGCQDLFVISVSPVFFKDKNLSYAQIGKRFCDGCPNLAYIEVVGQESNEDWCQQAESFKRYINGGKAQLRYSIEQDW